MLEFDIVISNELGEIIRYCDALTEAEIDRILEDHQEYTVLFVASEKDRF